MKDLKHYLSLAAVLSIGLGTFLIFDYNRQIQIGIIMAMGAAYVIWGLVHHVLKKELRPRIILEYLLVAFLATTITIFLLLRT